MYILHFILFTVASHRIEPHRSKRGKEERRGASYGGGDGISVTERRNQDHRRRAQLRRPRQGARQRRPQGWVLHLPSLLLNSTSPFFISSRSASPPLMLQIEDPFSSFFDRFFCLWSNWFALDSGAGVVHEAHLVLSPKWRHHRGSAPAGITGSWGGAGRRHREEGPRCHRGFRHGLRRRYWDLFLGADLDSASSCRRF